MEKFLHRHKDWRPTWKHDKQNLMAEAPHSKWRMFCLLLTGYDLIVYLVLDMVFACGRAFLLIGGLLVWSGHVLLWISITLQNWVARFQLPFGNYPSTSLSLPCYTNKLNSDRPKALLMDKREVSTFRVRSIWPLDFYIKRRWVFHLEIPVVGCKGDLA